MLIKNLSVLKRYFQTPIRLESNSYIPKLFYNNTNRPHKYGVNVHPLDKIYTKKIQKLYINSIIDKLIYQRVEISKVSY